MDNDDESLLTPIPDHFLLSTYKENLSGNMNSSKIDENLKIILSYKCYLCRRILDNPILTCAECVNTGQFCSSKHDLCSNKRREILLNLLNPNDYEEFQQYSTHKTIHLQCSDRMFLLKKFHLEKTILQSEFQQQLQSSIEIRLMSQDIQLRKSRLKFVHQSIENLRDEIERKKQRNIKIQQSIDQVHSRIETIKKTVHKTKRLFKSSYNEIQKRIDDRNKEEQILQTIRQERFQELITYLFPIQHVSAVEDVLTTRIKALLNAQQTTMDEMNDEQVENDDDDDDSFALDSRYQIVNSFLPSNGDYQIDNLVSIYNVSATKAEPTEILHEIDSPQLSPSCDSYEILSALSHACQLINVIAFYLHINLPFRLHQLEFDTDNFTSDCLRANIAKLNTNITSSCLSQGIPIEMTNVTYTLENLFKLLTYRNYSIRPKPVVYSQDYMDMIEKEVSEISRAFISHYWFDDDDDEKDLRHVLNSYEWESAPQNEYIPNEQSINEHSDSSPSTSAQLQSSVMSSSIDFLKTKSSDIVNSIFRNFKT